MIEQGKAGELRQRAFWQLWELNRRIASGDWGRIGDAELRRKLEAATPLGDEAAPVWGPLEFWACYCGLRPVPPAFASTPAPLIGARQAAVLSSRWRRQLQTLIEEHQLDAALAGRSTGATSMPCSPAFAATPQPNCWCCGWRRIATGRSCGSSSGNGRCQLAKPRQLDARNPLLAAAQAPP